MIDPLIGRQLLTGLFRIARRHRNAAFSTIVLDPVRHPPGRQRRYPWIEARRRRRHEIDLVLSHVWNIVTGSIGASAHRGNNRLHKGGTGAGRKRFWSSFLLIRIYMHLQVSQFLSSLPFPYWR